MLMFFLTFILSDIFQQKVTDYLKKTPCDPQRFSKVLNDAKSLQNKGNEQFKLKCFANAISMYERGVELLYIVGCKNEK